MISSAAADPGLSQDPEAVAREGGVVPLRYQLAEVPVDLVGTVWTTLRDEIRSALSHGQGDMETEQSILEGVLGGRSSLWAVQDATGIKACLVVCEVSGTRGKKLWVELVAGEDMPGWAELVESTLVAVRDALGCMCVEASCRPGLARFLEARGWRKKAIIMEL